MVSAVGKHAQESLLSLKQSKLPLYISNCSRCHHPPRPHQEHGAQLRPTPLATALCPAPLTGLHSMYSPCLFTPPCLGSCCSLAWSALPQPPLFSSRAPPSLASEALRCKQSAVCWLLRPQFCVASDCFFSSLSLIFLPKLWDRWYKALNLVLVK